MIAGTKQLTYSDLESMTDLRQQAHKDPNATLRQVAKHFESLYMNMMLKSMRQASMGDPIFDSNSSGLYRDMYDQQIALQMSQHQGIGLADVLVKQLQGGLTTSHEAEQADAKIKTVKPIDLTPSDPPLIRTNIPVKRNDPVVFNSKTEFVETLMPYAEKAADELGVAPQVLIAQAALETGWGKHVCKQPDGKSSYNLFNIKADERWSGKSANKQTLEYHNGVANKEQASFRVYNTYQESFNDYVKFVKSNPRYQAAIDNVMQPERYISELQQAGYATDPNYADKVSDIYQREVVGAPYSEFLMEDQV